MSLSAYVWARSVDLPAAEKAVLKELAIRASEDSYRQCYPSIGQLASDCGLSKRTVQRALQTLQERGYVDRRPRFNDQGRQIHNDFFITPGGEGDTMTPSGRQSDTPGGDRVSPHSKTVEKSVPEEDERVREGRLFEELDPEAAQFIAEIDRKMGNANWQVAAWFKFAASPTLRQLEGVALEDRKRILTDAIIDMTADAQTPNMRWLQAAVIKRAEQLKEEGAPGEQKHAHANRMWHVWTDEELDKYMAENPDWSIPT